MGYIILWIYIFTLNYFNVNSFKIQRQRFDSFPGRGTDDCRLSDAYFEGNGRCSCPVGRQYYLSNENKFAKCYTGADIKRLLSIYLLFSCFFLY